MLVILYVGIAGLAYACQSFFGLDIPYAFWGSYLIFIEGWIALASVQYARTAQNPLQTRISYAFFGLAFILCLAADSSWVLSLSATGERPGLISPYYFLRIAFSLAAIVGLCLQLKFVLLKHRALTVVDSLLVSTSLILVGWELGFDRLWSAPNLSLAVRISQSILAGADVFALTLSVVLVLSSMKTGKIALKVLLLALAIGLVMISDLSSILMVYNKTYYEGCFSDIIAVVAMLFAGYSAALYDQERSFVTPKPYCAKFVLVCHFIQRTPGIVAFTTLFLALGSDLLTPSPVSLSSLGICLALLAFLGARQFLSILDDHHGRTKELEEIRETLESDVQHKTAQMREMLELTHAVNETLDISHILCRSLDHARKVVRCTNGVARFYQDDFLASVREQAEWREGQPVSVTPHYAVRSISNFAENNPSAEAFGRWGAFYVISVDIWINDEIAGWIALGRPDVPFEASDIELLKGVGQIASPAIANANSYRLAKDASERDPTTCLLNHRAVHEKLVLDLVRAKKNNKQLSLIMIDINNFQRFNATYGHNSGDELLKKVAKTIAQVVPCGSLIGRFGADEFVVGMLSHDSASAMKVAGAVSAALAGQCIQLENDDRQIPIAITCGIASYPDDCDTYEELLLAAEQNLERARLVGQDVATTPDVCRLGREMRSDSSFAILDMLVTAVDNKDSYTRKHSEQVAEYATWLCEAIELDADATRLIQQAALLHDVGKIGVPSEILGKPGRLTEEEIAAINKHPWLGASLVAAFKDMEDIIPGVKHHHERWDGLGYPDKLAGSEIPLMARILCIADTFSAMVTDRAYRKALSWDVALQEFESHIGTQFDPELGFIFSRVAKRKLAAFLPQKRRVA